MYKRQVYATSKPFKLCTFSRVMKEKGIEDAVNAVEEINKKYDETIFTLDIYGQIDTMQTEWFESLQSRFLKDVSYKGLVPFDKSTDVLKNYYALLFPTSVSYTHLVFAQKEIGLLSELFNLQSTYISVLQGL